MNKGLLGFVCDFFDDACSIVLRYVWKYYPGKKYYCSVYIADDLLVWAAKNDSIKMCNFAKNIGATNFNEMNELASERGNEMMCKLALSWGANNYDEMFENAVKGGYTGICWLAYGFVYTGFMLAEGASAGHEKICVLAKQWGEDDFGDMHYHAKTEKLKNLALKWEKERKEKLGENDSDY